MTDADTELADGLAQLLARLCTKRLGHECIEVGNRVVNLGAPNLLVDQNDETRHASGKAFGDIGNGLGTVDVQVGMRLKIAP